jgi:hypothetical protein
MKTAEEIFREAEVANEKIIVHKFHESGVSKKYVAVRQSEIQITRWPTFTVSGSAPREATSDIEGPLTDISILLSKMQEEIYQHFLAHPDQAELLGLRASTGDVVISVNLRYRPQKVSLPHVPRRKK